MIADRSDYLEGQSNKRGGENTAGWILLHPGVPRRWRMRRCQKPPAAHLRAVGAGPSCGEARTWGYFTSADDAQAQACAAGMLYGLAQKPAIVSPGMRNPHTVGIIGKCDAMASPGRTALSFARMGTSSRLMRNRNRTGNRSSVRPVGLKLSTAPRIVKNHFQVQFIMPLSAEEVSHQFIQAEDAPPYCRGCGAQLPWTRQRLQAVAELADLQESLTAEEKLLLKKSFDDIIRDTAQSTVAAHRVKQLGAKAGKGFLDGARTILISVASEAAKKILFP
jgi:hypothetical protein